MCVHDLNIEFEKLGSTESVDLAQAATVTSHKEWLRLQKPLPNLFSPNRALKAFTEYHNLGELRKSDHQTDLTQICQI